MGEQGLNREEWLEKLLLLDQHLRAQGATACLTLPGYSIDDSTPNLLG